MLGALFEGEQAEWYAGMLDAVGFESMGDLLGLLQTPDGTTVLMTELKAAGMKPGHAGKVVATFFND